MFETIKGIQEIGLAVADLEATTRLYRDILGARASVVMTSDQLGSRSGICRWPGIDLRLMETSAARGIAGTVPERGDRLHYIGLQVDSVEDAITWMEQNQIHVVDQATRTDGKVDFAFANPACFKGVAFKLLAGKHDLTFPLKPSDRGLPEAARFDCLQHIGINVIDLEAALVLYSRLFQVRHSAILSRPRYGLRFAFLRAGNIDLELLSPTNDDGLLARSIAKIGEGIAHLCWLVRDIGAALAWLKRNNRRLVNDRPFPVGNLRAAFVHPAAFNGVLHELVQGEHTFFDAPIQRVV